MAQIYDSRHSGQEVDKAVDAVQTTIPNQLNQIGSNLDEVEAEIGKIDEFSFSAAGEKEYRFVQGNTYVVTNTGSNQFTISIRETKNGESHDATNVGVGKSVEITASIDGYWVRVGIACAFNIILKSSINGRLNTVEANLQGADDEPTAGSNNLVKSGGVAASLFDTLVDNEVKSDVSLANSQNKFPFGDAFMAKNETGYKYSVYLYGAIGKTVAIEFVNVETGNTVQSTGLVTIGDSGYIELERKRFDLDLKIKVIANSTSGGVYTVVVKKIINPESLIESTGIIEDVFDAAFNGTVQTDVSLANGYGKYPFGDALLKKTDSAIEYRIRMYGDAGKTASITTVNPLTGDAVETTGFTTIGDEGYIELNSERRDLDLKIEVIANSTSGGQYNVIVTKIDNTIQHTIQQEISNNVSVDDIKSSCLFSVIGFINAADGTVNTTNPYAVCTNFLAINSGHYIKVLGVSGENAALVAFYNDTKTFISALNGSTLNNTALVIEGSDIPSNAKYIRVSGMANQLNIANTGTPIEYPFNFRDSSLFTVEQKFVRYPDGELSPNPYYKCTDFIAYNGYGLMLNGAANDGNIALVAFYDVSKTFISAIRGTEKNEIDVILMPYQIPSNTKYFKVSCNINQNGNILNGENLSGLVTRVNNEDKNNKIAYQFTGADYDVSRLNVHESFTLKDTLGIYADYDALVNSYPDYVSKIDCDAIMQNVGVERPSALDNIPMYMYKFEPQYAQFGASHDLGIAIRPIKMFICTGTHDEPYAIQTAYNLLEKLCTSWDTDVNLEALRFNATIWVMPVGNPWAMMQPERGGGGVIRVNYDGVDLNRNMATSKWVAGTPGTRTYGGPEPNSEYESKVLAHMIGSVLPDIFIDFHNFGTDFVGNMMYYGPYDNRGKNIASEITSKMTRVLKKGNTDYVQDTTTMLGWLDPTIASARGFYAYEQNVPLSLTMEVAAGSPWDNGVLTSRFVSGGTSILMSENVQIFAYTLLRLAYNLTIE